MASIKPAINQRSIIIQWLIINLGLYHLLNYMHILILRWNKKFGGDLLIAK